MTRIGGGGGWTDVLLALIWFCSSYFLWGGMGWELAMNFIMFFCLFDFTAYFSWGGGGGS